MPLITVIGKDDLGFSPKFGPIIKGQIYEIEESDFADQLFNKADQASKPKGSTPDPGPLTLDPASKGGP